MNPRTEAARQLAGPPGDTQLRIYHAAQHMNSRLADMNYPADDNGFHLDETNIVHDLVDAADRANIIDAVETMLNIDLTTSTINHLLDYPHDDNTVVSSIVDWLNKQDELANS